MATVFDVAAHILQQQGPMTAMKLQKLVYYAQAWSLAWDESPLFDERLEAWANGPVSPDLYRAHKGKFKVEPGSIPGDPSKLSPAQSDTIAKVLQFYGAMQPQSLSDLSHQEKPWADARGGLPPSERGASVISHAEMAEYYGSL